MAAQLRPLTDSSLIIPCHSYEEQVPSEEGGKEGTLIQQEHVVGKKAGWIATRVVATQRAETPPKA